MVPWFGKMDIFLLESETERSMLYLYTERAEFRWEGGGVVFGD